MKKAYTDGVNVYTIDSLAPGCWKEIWVYTLKDWYGEKTCSFVLTSVHPAYKFLTKTEHGTRWIEYKCAERALDICAKKFGWKEI